MKVRNSTIIDKTAEIISVILSPITSTIILAGVVYYKYIPHTLRDFIIWLTLSGGFLLLCLFTIFFFMKIGLVGDFDITDRKQRPRIFLIFIALAVILTAISFIIGYTEASSIMAMAIVAFTIAVLITFFWKISIHTFTLNISLLVLYDMLDNPLLLFIFILSPIIAWSRVYLKRHTLYQTIGGILLSFIIYAIWKVFYPYNIFNLRPQ
ncbi:phosphatase PAP2 family protein [Candidatus Dojkabacteria bacterium]|nr:phosphatase PAP2 family protein [Candidatus Dojkabacteria bacterium]